MRDCRYGLPRISQTSDQGVMMRSDASNDDKKAMEIHEITLERCYMLLGLAIRLLALDRREVRYL